MSSEIMTTNPNAEAIPGTVDINDDDQNKNNNNNNNIVNVSPKPSISKRNRSSMHGGMRHQQKAQQHNKKRDEETVKKIKNSKESLSHHTSTTSPEDSSEQSSSELTISWRRHRSPRRTQNRPTTETTNDYNNDHNITSRRKSISPSRRKKEEEDASAKKTAMRGRKSASPSNRRRLDGEVESVAKKTAMSRTKSVSPSRRRFEDEEETTSDYSNRNAMRGRKSASPSSRRSLDGEVEAVAKKKAMSRTKSVSPSRRRFEDEEETRSNYNNVSSRRKSISPSSRKKEEEEEVAKKNVIRERKSASPTSTSSRRRLDGEGEVVDKKNSISRTKSVSPSRRRLEDEEEETVAKKNAMRRRKSVSPVQKRFEEEDDDEEKIAKKKIMSRRKSVSPSGRVKLKDEDDAVAKKDDMHRNKSISPSGNRGGVEAEEQTAKKMIDRDEYNSNKEEMHQDHNAENRIIPSSDSGMIDHGSERWEDSQRSTRRAHKTTVDRTIIGNRKSSSPSTRRRSLEMAVPKVKREHHVKEGKEYDKHNKRATASTEQSSTGETDEIIISWMRENHSQRSLPSPPCSPTKSTTASRKYTSPISKQKTAAITKKVNREECNDKENIRQAGLSKNHMTTITTSTTVNFVVDNNNSGLPSTIATEEVMIGGEPEIHGPPISPTPRSDKKTATVSPTNGKKSLSLQRLTSSPSTKVDQVLSRKSPSSKRPTSSSHRQPQHIAPNLEGNRSNSTNLDGSTRTTRSSNDATEEIISWKRENNHTNRNSRPTTATAITDRSDNIIEQSLSTTAFEEVVSWQRESPRPSDRIHDDKVMSDNIVRRRSLSPVRPSSTSRLPCRTTTKTKEDEEKKKNADKQHDGKEALMGDFTAGTDEVISWKREGQRPTNRIANDKPASNKMRRKMSLSPIRPSSTSRLPCRTTTEENEEFAKQKGNRSPKKEFTSGAEEVISWQRENQRPNHHFHNDKSTSDNVMSLSLNRPSSTSRLPCRTTSKDVEDDNNNNIYEYGRQQEISVNMEEWIVSPQSRMEEFTVGTEEVISWKREGQRPMHRMDKPTSQKMRRKMSLSPIRPSSTSRLPCRTTTEENEGWDDMNNNNAFPKQKGKGLTKKEIIAGAEEVISWKRENQRPNHNNIQDNVMSLSLNRPSSTSRLPCRTTSKETEEDNNNNNNIYEYGRQQEIFVNKEELVTTPQQRSRRQLGVADAKQQEVTNKEGLEASPQPRRRQRRTSIADIKNEVNKIEPQKHPSHTEVRDAVMDGDVALKSEENVETPSTVPISGRTITKRGSMVIVPLLETVPSLSPNRPKLLQRQRSFDGTTNVDVIGKSSSSSPCRGQMKKHRSGILDMFDGVGTTRKEKQLQQQQQQQLLETQRQQKLIQQQHDRHRAVRGGVNHLVMMDKRMSLGN